MKKSLFMLMLLVASGLNAQNKLTIVIDGIEKLQGQILVGVYDSAGFLRKAAYGVIVKADKNEVTVVIDSIATGKYAVSIFHDENDNYKLDTGQFGIPIEKTGLSNNAKSKTGPPKFNDCAFKLEEDAVIYITLQEFKLPN
ncbi:MAG: DUF2141 domain-containing protein [Prevotellaceae bacterium]|jgi:uncharacterized protein (DUF2141 family)|nr:DUF2141 domain-containing protein [Prevotellaceae bacterium]